MSIGDDIREIAFREAKGLLRDAIDDRRQHPYYYYLVHMHMATLRRRQGRRLAAFWHRRWREYYYARAQATREAQVCVRMVEG